MSEAARAAVPFLLDQPGVDGLEAWVDSRNVTSLAVARAAGMTERGRLPRVYPDRVAQTVVMVRASVDTDPEVLGAFATLQVRDVAETLRVLRCVVCLHVAWALPDPPVLAFVAFEPWSGSAGFQVQQSAGPIVATAMSLDVGISVDVVRERVVSAGLPVVEEPADMPWARRQMVFLLPEGHRLTVSGPSSPHP